MQNKTGAVIERRTMKDQRAELLNELGNIQGRLKAENRDLTAAEANDVERKTAQIEDLTKRIDAADEGERLLAAFGGNAPDLYAGMNRSGAKSTASGRLGMKHMDRGTAAVRELSAKVSEAVASKSLFSGEGLAIPERFIETPVLEPNQMSWSVSQWFPAQTLTSPSFQYLRQVTRDQKAAVVQPGALKPTSEYTFEPITGRLEIVAHLSQPLHTYWLVDHPESIAAVVNEMITGLLEAEDRIIIAGNGTSEPTGLLNTSGIQVQAFASDALTTTRTAVTTLETLGLHGGVFVMNPRDWQAIELTRDPSGRLEFTGGPVDTATKRLWGVPVATSGHMPEGTALLADTTSVHVLSDGNYVMETGLAGDDFARNQVTLRAEHRMNLAVTRPIGVVKINLTA